MFRQRDEDIERGYVLLQAAVAEGALGDVKAADLRAEELAAIDGPAVLVLARVAADFVCRMSLAQGADWTTSRDVDGNMVNIEDRSPGPRVFTRRVLAAWSVGDTDTFDALLAAAYADPHQRRPHLEDLFGQVADKAAFLGDRFGRSFTVVRQMTKSILKEGLQRADWNS